MKKKLFLFFYDVVLHLFFILFIPVFIKRVFFDSKYKNSFGRLGLGKIRKLKIDPSRPVIWIHGASVGEILLMRSVIDLIKKKSPNCFLLLTCCSELAFYTAEKMLDVVHHVAYLPLDISYLIKPIVKRINPSLVLISENDVWLNFLYACKRLKSKFVIVNGKLSNKSFRNFSKFKFLAKLIFNEIDIICLQDEEYRRKFLSLNIEKKKLIVTGNIKTIFFNSKLSSSDLYEFKEYLGLAKEDIVFTLGSTHEGEEEMWVDVFNYLVQKEPNLKLIIVPRHIFRINRIQKMLNQKGLKYGLWGEKKVFEKHNILLVNVMGELCNIYQISDYAFVGGTFTEKIGGHNLLEPIFYNIPLFFGPYTFSQSRIANLIIEKKCGVSLPLHDFYKVIIHALGNKELLSSLVKNGSSLLKEENSSLNRTWDVISNFIPC